MKSMLLVFTLLIFAVSATAAPVTYYYTGNPYTEADSEDPDYLFTIGRDYLFGTAVLDITPGVASVGLAATLFTLRTTSPYFGDDALKINGTKPCVEDEDNQYFGPPDCFTYASSRFDVDEQGNITYWEMYLEQIGLWPYLVMGSRSHPLDEDDDFVGDFAVIDYDAPSWASSTRAGTWSLTAPAAVPEPLSVASLLAGLLGLGLWKRRQRD